MAGDGLEELYFRHGFDVKVSALDADFVAGKVEGDPFGGIELGLVDVAVGDGQDVAILFAKFQHRRPLARAPQEPERAEVGDVGFIVALVAVRPGGEFPAH